MPADISCLRAQNPRNASVSGAAPSHCHHARDKPFRGQTENGRCTAAKGFDAGPCGKLPEPGAGFPHARMPLGKSSEVAEVAPTWNR